MAVDLFCACTGGKVGPFFLNPGNPGLTADATQLHAAGQRAANSPPTGPGSFVVSNKGADGKFALQEQRGVGADRGEDHGQFGQPERRR